MSDSLVIIPTYNEGENIGEMIQQVFSLEQSFHLLIIDDNSPDGTGDFIKQLQNNYPEQLHLIERTSKQGLGTAYITGFRWALEKKYDYIFEMDADFSHDPKDLVRLHRACSSEGADLTIGSRYLTGVNVVNWPIGRVLLSYFASRYVQWVTGMPIQDTTAGYICYRRRVLENINFDFIKFRGYAFQIEMKFTAWQLGFNLVEIPIIFTDRSKGESKMSKGIFREAFLGVLEMKLKGIFRDLAAIHRKSIGCIGLNLM